LSLKPESKSTSWTARIRLPQLTQIQYKYIIVSPTDASLRVEKWEGHQQNRALSVKGTTMLVQDGKLAERADKLELSNGWLDREFQLRIRMINFQPIGFTPPFSYQFLTTKNQAEIWKGIFTPSSNEIIYQASCMEDFSFHIDVCVLGTRVGRCFISHHELVSRIGSINRPVISADLSVIGFLNFDFLVVSPFIHPNNNLSRTSRNFWSPQFNVIGHRGFGKTCHTFVRENTLLSFNLAKKFGFQFVEFDVHITSDNVPIIYHDFFIPTTRSNKPENVISTPIRGLTLNQFKNLQVRDLNPSEPPRSGDSGKLKRSLSAPDQSDPNIMWAISERSFPTLKELFEGIPPGVGFNVELKYPSKKNEQKAIIQERNLMVDLVLEVIFNSVGDRNLYFSSFDPSLCIILSQKQARFPVFFLTSGKRSHEVRKGLLSHALEFASAAGLQGIVCESSALMKSANLIHEIHKAGLLLFSYGATNNNPDLVKLQLEAGVDAIITDKITRIAASFKKL